MQPAAKTSSTDHQVPSFEVEFSLDRQRPFCVVIPVINEGDRIQNLLRRMTALNIAAIADIVIVDGGSKDGSLDLDFLKSQHVRALITKTGKGKLSAQLRCAYSFALQAQYEGIVTIDGNDKDDPDAIPAFVRALAEGGDFVQGSRFIPGGVAVNTPFVRYVAIRAVHAPLLSIAAGFTWTDTTQGFRAYSARLLRDDRVGIFRDCFNGYELLAYLSYIAPRLGYICSELPTSRRYPDGEVPTKISKFRGNLDVFLVLLRACLGRYDVVGTQFPARLTALERLSTACIGLSLGIACLSALVRLKSTPRYSDFIVGSITWFAEGKLWDYVSPILALASVGLGVWVAAHCLMTAIASQRPGIVHAFLSSGVPAALFVGQLLSQGQADLALPIAGAAASSFVILAARLRSIRLGDLDSRIISRALGAGLFMGIAPIAIIATASHFIGRDILRTSELHRASWIAVLMSAVAVLFAIARTHKRAPGVVSIIASVGQLLSAPLFFVLSPRPLLQPDGSRIGSSAHVTLNILLGALVVCAFFDVAMRYAWRSRRAHDDRWAFSPLAAVALLALFRFGVAQPPIITQDDYHFGESLVGNFAYTHGAVPYVDSIPAHGLVEDDLPGFVSSLFYNGTASSLNDAARLAWTLLAIPALIAMRRSTRSGLIAFLCCYFVAVRPAWLFVIPFIALWSSIRWRERPMAWMTAFIASVPLLVLGAPPQAALLLPAYSPLALAMVILFLRRESKRTLFIWMFAVVIAVVAFMASPLGAMTWAATRYVIENSAVNSTAYGMAWSHSWGNGPSRGLIFELLRMSWLGGIWVGGWMTIRYRGEPLQTTRALPAFCASLFLVLAIPYAMGRIDAQAISRPGLTALFACCALVPLIVWTTLSAEQRSSLVLGIAILGAALSPGDIGIRAMDAAAASSIPSPVLIDTAALGLPNVGRAAMEPEHLERLQQLDAYLDRTLTEQETYLDLTSRNAEYFYVGRRPSVAVSAPYNLVSPQQQKREVERLSAAPPAIALIEAANISQDGGGIALRNPILYRFVLDHYIPERSGKLLFGRLGERALTDDEVTLLDHAITQHQLAAIPRAWGGSWASLKSEVTHAVPLAIERLSANLVQLSDASRAPINGRDVGLLALDIRCDRGRVAGSMQIDWSGERTVQCELTSSIASGLHIVPMDASAAWVLQDRIDKITIRLEPSGSCSEPIIETATLYQRRSISQ